MLQNFCKQDTGQTVYKRSKYQDTILKELDGLSPRRRPQKINHIAIGKVLMFYKVGKFTENVISTAGVMK